MREYKIIKPDYWKYSSEFQTSESQKFGELKWKSNYSYCVDFVGRSNQWSTKSNTWGTKISILDKRQIEVGKVTINPWKGTTLFEYKGREYKFKHYHWASTIHLWEDMEGRKLISFKGSYKMKGDVGTIRSYRELDNDIEDLLIHLGWYFMILRQMQMG